MPRGRPRKASNVLELTGRFKTNPDRRTARENEPTPSIAINDTPPNWMTKAQRACYRELVRGCHADVLSSADGTWVEITACLLSEYREDPRSIKPQKLSRLMTCLGQLGMSPADRSRASKIKRENKNRFAKFDKAAC